MKSSISPEVVALREAKARYDRAQAEVHRIAASAEQAPAPDTSATDGALAAARRAFEDTAGAHALGDATEADLAQAQSVLDAAQRAANRANDDARRISAASAGLARKLEAARAEVEDAADALREAEVAWLSVELVAADREHSEAIERLGRAFGRVKGLGTAITRRDARPPVSVALASVVRDLPFFGMASSRDEQQAAMRKAFTVDPGATEAALARAAASD